MKNAFMRKQYFVYIITNKRNTVLYIGVTGNLERRIYEHKKKLIDGFSKKYNLTKLVHFEEGDDISFAIEREKELKGWLRKKKDALINEENPKWEDLAKGWFD